MSEDEASYRYFAEKILKLLIAANNNSSESPPPFPGASEKLWRSIIFDNVMDYSRRVKEEFLSSASWSEYDEWLLKTRELCYSMRFWIDPDCIFYSKADLPRGYVSIYMTSKKVANFSRKAVDSFAESWAKNHKGKACLFACTGYVSVYLPERAFKALVADDIKKTNDLGTQVHAKPKPIPNLFLSRVLKEILPDIPPKWKRSMTRERIIRVYDLFWPERDVLLERRGGVYTYLLRRLRVSSRYFTIEDYIRAREHTYALFKESHAGLLNSPIEAGNCKALCTRLSTITNHYRPGNSKMERMNITQIVHAEFLFEIIHLPRNTLMNLLDSHVVSDIGEFIFKNGLSFSYNMTREEAIYCRVHQAVGSTSA